MRIQTIALNAVTSHNPFNRSLVRKVMKSIGGTHAAMFVACIAFAVSGCHELGSPSVVLPAKAVGHQLAQGEPGAYIGDVFSEVQKALAALPRNEPDLMPYGE